MGDGHQDPSVVLLVWRDGGGVVRYPMGSKTQRSSPPHVSWPIGSSHFEAPLPRRYVFYDTWLENGDLALRGV